jgi:hypothetical protein
MAEATDENRDDPDRLAAAGGAVRGGNGMVTGQPPKIGTQRKLSAEAIDQVR